MKKGCVISLLMIMAVMITSVVGRKPHLHRVGGSKGWLQNVNYTDWASHEPIFYVGDWLLFVFDKRIMSVFEVNKENYEACSEQNFITNVTRGGRDVFNLTEARPFYFISGGGFCFNGVKLAINVTADPAPSPAPSPSKEGQRTHPKSCSSQIELTSLCVILVAWAYSTFIS